MKKFDEMSLNWKWNIDYVVRKIYKIISPKILLQIFIKVV